MGIRWSSVWTVLGASVVALAFLSAALRGRAWAWVPCVLAAGIVVREVRWSRRRRRPEAGFDEPRR
ncbi:hypothetical protein DNL40_13000 [Xylanimonas oleitrophica]|uniref:Uncharacterized protein n=1 Tax=Xylanimonas oleitrophica TaxID=2607479 RepID=A0A2W5WLW6_9MICO|nr:hypothetical protein [Xylanimonas oleitrophica]PZR52190.1 hypothetical protein DNL40_13000 [Xylanimonas oleitrophica]